MGEAISPGRGDAVTRARGEHGGRHGEDISTPESEREQDAGEEKGLPMPLPELKKACRREALAEIRFGGSYTIM